jgi:alcohol dehydrogenase (cytochrome c)
MERSPGATNWYSPSYSPRTGLFYIPARENSSAVFVKGVQQPVFSGGKLFGGVLPTGRLNGAGVYSAIRAIDPLTGDRKWEYRLSASASRAGILTTASDLLFSGSHEGALYALEARDGRLLWQTNLGSPITVGPVTFSVAGKQYVSIQAGSRLFTFALRSDGRII